MAAVKAVVCITAIIFGGRVVLRPFYRRVADTDNPEIFAATTLLVVLATSLLTQVAGLSLALGAFLVRGVWVCRVHVRKCRLHSIACTWLSGLASREILSKLVAHKRRSCAHLLPSRRPGCPLTPYMLVSAGWPLACGDGVPPAG